MTKKQEKKIISLVSILGCVCLFGANAKSTQADISQFIVLANIEAIAEDESGMKFDCWEEKYLVFEPGYKTVDCENCSFVVDLKPKDFNTGRNTCTI